MSYSGDGSNNLNPWTTWTLRAPDTSGWDPTNNPILCQAEFPGIFPERSDDQPTGTVNSDHLSDLLKSATNYPGVQPAMRFADFFRRWVTICSVSTPDPGTYYLQVQTNLKIAASRRPTPAAPTGGRCASAWATTTAPRTTCGCTGTAAWASTRTRQVPTRSST